MFSSLLREILKMKIISKEPIGNKRGIHKIEPKLIDTKQEK